jgi:hypothetical protein
LKRFLEACQPNGFGLLRYLGLSPYWQFTPGTLLLENNLANEAPSFVRPPLDPARAKDFGLRRDFPGWLVTPDRLWVKGVPPRLICHATNGIEHSGAGREWPDDGHEFDHGREAAATVHPSSFVSMPAQILSINTPGRRRARVRP